jgi:hypothetical protein
MSKSPVRKCRTCNHYGVLGKEYYCSDICRIFGNTKKSERDLPGSCWNWLGSLDRDGYGLIAGCVTECNEYRAHRMSYSLFNRGIPEGLDVLHRCNNKSCVNPDHLKAGTHTENMQDKMAAGYQAPRGEKHSRAKLREIQVLSIRGDDRKLRQIADDYGVTYGAIYAIKHRHSWKHI